MLQVSTWNTAGVQQMSIGDGAAGASVQLALGHWYKSNTTPAHLPNFSSERVLIPV